MVAGTLVGLGVIAYLSGLFHEYIPPNHERYWTTYAMYLLRKWGRISQQCIIRLKVLSGKSFYYIRSRLSLPLFDDLKGQKNS